MEDDTRSELTPTKKRSRLFSKLPFIVLVTFFVGLLLPYFQDFISHTDVVNQQPPIDLTRPLTDYDKQVTLKPTTDQVTPAKGFQTKIILGDVIPKMVAAGVIDMSKMQALYKNSGMPEDEMELLTQPSDTPLKVDANNARWLVNLLWPIGLSNYMAVNQQSPIIGVYVNRYASTGGWNLGREETGGVYFNKYSLISLTPSQESRVLSIAQASYRPCCSNSTFF